MLLNPWWLIECMQSPSQAWTAQAYSCHVSNGWIFFLDNGFFLGGGRKTCFLDFLDFFLNIMNGFRIHKIWQAKYTEFNPLYTWRTSRSSQHASFQSTQIRVLVSAPWTILFLLSLSTTKHYSLQMRTRPPDVQMIGCFRTSDYIFFC